MKNPSKKAKASASRNATGTKAAKKAKKVTKAGKATKGAKKAKGRSGNEEQDIDRGAQQYRGRQRPTQDQSRDTEYRPQRGFAPYQDDRDFNRSSYRDDDYRRMEERRPYQDDYTYSRGQDYRDERSVRSGRRGGSEERYGAYYDDDMRRGEPSYDEGYSYHPYGDEENRQRQGGGGRSQGRYMMDEESFRRQRSVPRGGRDNMYGQDIYQGRGNRIRDR